MAISTISCLSSAFYLLSLCQQREDAEKRAGVIMEEGLGEDGNRGAVPSPQEEELGLDGMRERMPSP